MQQQISLTTTHNTYIQFSFQKSLRKYDKPHKKIKPNNSHYHGNSYSHCVNNNNASSVCRHCVEKIKSKNQAKSNQRVARIMNSRVNEIARSRNQAREFSQSKRRRERESSAKRNSSVKRDSQGKDVSQVDNAHSNISGKMRANYHQPLSQFKLDQQFNISLQKDNQRLSLQKDNQRLNLQKDNQQQYHHQWQQYVESDNGLSIQRMFTGQNNLNQQNGNNQCNNHCLAFEKYQESARIIEEQPDDSFSHIQIGQGLKSVLVNNSSRNDQKAQTGHIISTEHAQTTPSLLIQYPQISYTYFSSCSSLDSLQDGQAPDNNQLELQNDHNRQDPNDPIQILKLESKEELKKECRNDYRERIFYKIRKMNDVEQVLQECDSISETIQQHLEEIVQNNTCNLLYEGQNNSQPSLETTPARIPPQNQSKLNDQRLNNQGLNNQRLNKQTQDHPDHISNSQQSIHYPSQPNSGQQQLQPQTNPSFKRDRKSLEVSTKRKATKINFQIQQNYQCLGRIKISGLGQEKESICLSIRRFSHDSKQSIAPSSKTNQISIDKSKMVDYLISQRPYLSKNRQQLINLLSQIIHSQEHNSVTKRLFQ